MTAPESPRGALPPDAETLRDIRDHFRNVTPDKLLFKISDGSGEASRYTHEVVAATVARAISRMEWQDSEIVRLTAEHKDYRDRRGAEVGALRAEVERLERRLRDEESANALAVDGRAAVCDALRGERDALAAHVEALRSELEALVEQIKSSGAFHRVGVPFLMSAADLLARTPTQSLTALRASVRSEALREAAAVVSDAANRQSALNDGYGFGVLNLTAAAIMALAQKGANDEA